MANNINVTEGSGKTVATEDIGSAQYQRIKVVSGDTSSVTGWTINADGSGKVALTSTNASIITVGSAVANQSVSGAVSVSNFPTNQNVSGSIVAFQGTTPWNISGSVASFIQGNASVVTVFGQNPSIVGTYAEDAQHTTGDKGLFVLAVRNDTMSSVTSASGDYSPVATGPTGEIVTANSPITKWVSGNSSFLTGNPIIGGSVAVIGAQGSSIFTYITAINVVNMSASNVLVRFDGATSSIVGYTIAPANGGSNIILPNAWKTNANGAFTASISGVSSVYVTASGFISNT